MKKFFIMAGTALVLAGCNSDGTLTQKSQNILDSMTEVSCVVDGVLQPIAVVIGPVAAQAAGVPAGVSSLVMQIDAPLHASIQAGCAALKGSIQEKATAPITPAISPTLG